MARDNDMKVCTGDYGGKDKDKVQFKLRACAKCLSLQAVSRCPDLKALVFMERFVHTTIQRTRTIRIFLMPSVSYRVGYLVYADNGAQS